MKIVTFNVNSIRARLHQLEAVISTHQPDLIALQETKVRDEEFPVKEIESLGYKSVWYGQKTHYGVATLSREEPITVTKGFPTEAAEAQKRLLVTRHALPDGQMLHFINGYFPQGETRHHPDKFPNKARFYSDLQGYLTGLLSVDGPLIVAGDLNVAPEDADVGIGEENARRWLRSGKCSFLPEEREWLQTLKSVGLVDCLRALYPDQMGMYSWFDYRSRGFERNPKRGLRIDLILCSVDMAKQCVAGGIDYDVRAMERPSDHAPVWAEFNFNQIGGEWRKPGAQAVDDTINCPVVGTPSGIVD